MGAITNLRPDLWAGIVGGGAVRRRAQHHERRVSLPLTPAEWPEWGDPLTDAAGAPT